MTTSLDGPRAARQQHHNQRRANRKTLVNNVLLSTIATVNILSIIIIINCSQVNYGEAALKIVTSCDCNPIGSNSTTDCNRFNGQCECKNANIVGLKCDLCRENYHDLLAGCKECDTCYQIVQLGVEFHRREADKLREYIEKLEHNPEIINDKKFANDLLDLMNRVNSLLRQAESAQGIEATLLSQLENLLARLRKIKETSMNIERYLGSTRPLLGEGVANITIAENVLKRILEEAAKAEKYILNEGMLALNKARERADRMGKQSEKMADLAKESRQLADQHERDAARIKDLANTAMNYTNLAYTLVIDARTAQETNAKNIAKLKQQIEKIVDLLKKTSRMATEATNDARRSYDEALALYTLINSLQIKRADIPRLKQEALDYLREAQRLKLEVEAFIARHAQLLDSTQFKLNEMKSLLVEAMRQQGITDAQLADIDNSIQKAKDAIKQADKTLKDAQDTLATLKKFDLMVQESREDALEALKKIPLIRKMIKDAEDKTKDAGAKLDTALADATEARDIARQAFLLANETSMDVKKIRLEASELKVKINTLKTRTGELAENLNHTSAAMDQYEQVAKTDGELALLTLERANQASLSANNATKTARALLDVINPLLNAIDKIEGIDGNKLAQLEAELDKLRQKLIESNLNAITDDLLAEREKQKQLMAEYQLLIDWLIKEVANIRVIRDSLPDKCFKRNRLEIPKQQYN